jgi:predicted dehydrogenase
LGQTWTLASDLAARAAPDSDAETHVSALIRCEGGTVISYERAEFAAAQTENAWKIVGSRGALHLRMIAESEKRIAYDASSDAEGVSPQVLWEGTEDAAHLHAGPLRDFAAAIREGRPPKTTLEQALVVQKISDAIYASADKGMAVAI